VPYLFFPIPSIFRLFVVKYLSVYSLHFSFHPLPKLSYSFDPSSFLFYTVPSFKSLIILSSLSVAFLLFFPSFSFLFLISFQPFKFSPILLLSFLYGSLINFSHLPLLKLFSFPSFMFRHSSCTVLPSFFFPVLSFSFLCIL
jgi:hypothetical protein